MEHDPEEIWRNTQEVIAAAMAQRSLLPADLAAVGITNQRETTVVWNRKTGEAVCNAIVWQDMRVADAVAEFSQAGGQDRFRGHTGLPLSTYFSALKIRWILENVPGDVLFGNIDTYLVWQLTGGTHGGMHITDVTNASRTQLMSLDTLDWDSEILKAFAVPRAMLPQIRSSSEIYAHAKTTAVQGTAIAGTYGTGCFMLMNTATRAVPSKHGMLTTVAYRFGKQPACYALEGSVAIAGALVQWLRDNLGLIEKSSDVEVLARSVKDNGGVYFVPAFSGLYAPHWKSNARGVIAGLTRYANKGHIARAVLEATAFQTCEVLEAMEKDSGISLDVLRTDGGMVENELLMQFQADILDRPVVRPAVKETTALGAAYAAGLAVDYFHDLDELRSNWAVEQTWKPNMEKKTREEMYRYWKRAVAKSTDWLE